MKSFITSSGVALCGLVTSVLTAVGVVLVQNLTGFNLFTLSFWVVLPVGAFLVGFAAASGYFFGSLYFHKKPGLLLLLQMVLIAAFTQLLIYYMEYSTLILDDGTKASEYIAFGQYLDLSLTKAHYRIGRSAQHDMGEAGSFGYWMAFFQFIGFMLGGVSVYVFLSGRPICQACDKYFRPLGKKIKSFGSTDDLAAYYDVLYTHPVVSEPFSQMIRSEYKVKTEKGSFNLTETLHGCPQCKAQMIEHSVQVFNGQDWKDIDQLKRQVSMPETVNLVSVFKA